MRWAPITLRIDAQSAVVVSGVYLTTSNHEIVLTVSQKLKKELVLSNGRAIGTLNCSQHEVVWEHLSLVSSELLEICQSELKSLGAVFQFPVPELLVLKFVNPPSETPRTNLLPTHAFRPFGPHYQQLLSQPVTVTSSPFAHVHTALFHGYKSAGIISCVKKSYLLIDARFLEGMEGGMVNTTKNSIGLVLGPLVKTNGEGRLLVVLPWYSIGAHLPKHLASIAISPLNFQIEGNSNSWQGVVSVVIKQGNCVLWGSGVLITPSIVATNNHVVRNHTKEQLEIRAHFRHHRSAAEVSVPLPGLDLVFIKLSKPITDLNPVTLATEDPDTGDSVKSIGFGLFLPRENSLPLESRGIISKNGDGMLVSSAGCWNGSSGGGLFNQCDELVGMMAANARENDRNEIMTDMCMAIPASLIRLALTHQKMDPRVSFLWKLQPTYQNIEAKL